ncbi:hypothetical protein SERLA73DRAFT_81640 [Serpula lacrymans var. lacrymans S7.3]|uniref:Uncharacterized protein n=1 Tax=Serpula lacrymans var. lacrymans (strain S7.3) TaxID=936435 RepID=F8QL47_SERL3|nr:hypothetical protein SERLA73DRAFT_81640 [Serpula lacrymans var. lacrymans S7.3]
MRRVIWKLRSAAGGPISPPGPGAGTSSIRPNGMDSEGGVGGGGGTLSEDLFKPGK